MKCVVCVESFFVYPSRIDRKFCSKKCAYKSNERSAKIVSQRRLNGSYKVSELTKAKMSASHKGVPLSKKHRKNLEGRRPWNARGMSQEERSWVKNKRNRVVKRLKTNGLSHTFGEWEKLKARYGFSCPSCQRVEPQIKLTEDHIMPLSKGGSDIIENIQPLCQSCNSKKHTKEIKFLTPKM